MTSGFLRYGAMGALSSSGVDGRVVPFLMSFFFQAPTARTRPVERVLVGGVATGAQGVYVEGKDGRREHEA